MEKDAYITLSWANQMYSLPEVREFVDEEELDEFLQEDEREPSSLTARDDGTLSAEFPRTLDLSLDEDRDGNLIEAPEDRAFTIGKDIEAKAIKWKGKISVVVQSMIAPSQELERQRKLELYNLVTPVVQAISQMLAGGQFKIALDMAKPVVQILEIQDEKPENWLPDQVVKLLENPEMAAQMEQQKQMAQQAAQPLFVPQGGAEEPTATPARGGGISPVIPRDEVANPVRDSLEATGNAPMLPKV